jgi:hypothetical protein
MKAHRTYHTITMEKFLKMEKETKVLPNQTNLAQALNGAIIFTGIGSIWAIYGVVTLQSQDEPWLTIALGFLALCLFSAIYFLHRKIQGMPGSISSLADQNRIAWAGRMFVNVNIVQGVLIFVAVQICNNLGYPEYLSLVITVIVGLHFIVLAPIMRTRLHWVLGLLMCLLALVTVLIVPKYAPAMSTIAQPVFVWGVVLGLGNALLLWSSSVLRMRLVQKSL